MPIVVVAGALVAASVWLALLSKPFVPAPTMFAWRVVMTGSIVAVAVLLVMTLTRDWWVVHDWEREATITSGRESALVRTIVGAQVLGAVLAVAGVWGRRNWTPPALLVAWVLMGFTWAFEATGETTDSDASGEALSGLRLATWSLLALTLIVIAASFGRLAEHRRAAAHHTPARAAEAP